MIKLDETNYIDLSYDKVTPEQRQQICEQFNYCDYAEFYMILFKHNDSFYRGYDSYTSNNKLYPDRLTFLIGRKEIHINNIGGM